MAQTVPLERVKLSGEIAFLVREACKRGCYLVKGSNHVRLMGRGGEQVAVLPYGASGSENGRRLDNMRAAIKRSGYLGTPMTDKLRERPPRGRGRRGVVSQERKDKTDILRAALMPYRGKAASGVLNALYENPPEGMELPSRGAASNSLHKLLADSDYWPSEKTLAWMEALIPEGDMPVKDPEVPELVTDPHDHRPGFEALRNGSRPEPEVDDMSARLLAAISPAPAPKFPELTVRLALALSPETEEAEELIRQVWELETGAAEHA